jgi:hypothetical protein
MSDDAPAFWNAFDRTMECPNTKRLLCTWHVDRNWTKKLKVVSDPLLRAKTYSLLCLLRTELDEAKFRQMLASFVERIKTDEGTRLFGEYFEKYYASKPLLWAACFRQHAYINTNMFTEAMHKVLKYSVFEKQAIRRIDKAIHLLLHHFNDMYKGKEIALV